MLDSKKALSTKPLVNACQSELWGGRKEEMLSPRKKQLCDNCAEYISTHLHHDK